MSGPGLPWLRLWTDFVGDFRVNSVPEAMQARLVKLWCLHRRGLLVAVPVAQLAFELRLSVADVEETLRVLSDAGLLLADRTPNGWDARQRQYDDAATRMRELRHARREGPQSPPGPPSSDKTRTDKRGAEPVLNTFRTCSEHGSTEAASPGVAIPLRDGGTFTPSAEQLAAWRQAYPGLDVVAEVRKAAAWALANEAKRKTRRGAPRFLNAWLANAKSAPAVVGEATPTVAELRAAAGRGAAS